MPDIEAPVQRAQGRMDASTDAIRDGLNVYMTRKQFWECFTDYSVIRQGQFLSVPLKLFDVFSAPEHKGLVNVVEVLLILALHCTGDVKDQLMFCFELFDDDNSDSMDVEEMTNFLWVLASAGNKVGKRLPGFLLCVPPDMQHPAVCNDRSGWLAPCLRSAKCTRWLAACLRWQIPASVARRPAFLRRISSPGRNRM